MDHQLARIRLASNRIQDRRAADRDRRLLEGTMKYRGQFHHVEVHSLSESGAYAVGPITPELTDAIVLNIDLPHLGGSVMITGRVRRVGLGSRSMERRGGFAIEFTRFYSQFGRDTLTDHISA